MELEQFDVLLYDVRCCPIHLIPLQLFISLHNIRQLVSEVIL